MTPPKSERELPDGQVHGQRWLTAPPGHRLPARPIEITYFKRSGEPTRFACYASETACQVGAQLRAGEGETVEEAYDSIFRSFLDGSPVGPWFNPLGVFFIPVDPAAAAERLDLIQKERDRGTPKV